MAELIQLKRLKDLKIVGKSTTNGNITLDGVESIVYTHPTTHSADIIIDGTTNKAYTSIEKTKLSGIKEGATKVDISTVNGNVKINGVESNVYTQPSVGYNRVNEDTWEIRVTPDNMHNIIYPTDVGWTLMIVFTTQVQAIDEGFTYTVISGTTDVSLEGFRFIKEGSSGQTEFTGCISAWVNTHYEITKINGIYKIMQSGGKLATVSNTGEYDDLLNHPYLYRGIRDGESGYGGSSIRMGNCNYTTKSDASIFGTSNIAYYDKQTVIGEYNTNIQDSYFTVGNGSTDVIRSNAFEVYKNGIVGIFGDIKIKGGTVLKTISQTIQGAINELYDSIVPHLTDTVKHITGTERTNWNNAVQTVFAGTLNNSLLTVKDTYINKDTCVTDHVTKTANTYFTFKAPYDGVYELDGRCTVGGGGIVTVDATIGTAKLVKVFNRTMAIGETIRFNNTLMVLPVGYEITLVPMSGLDTIIDNVHFVIKYLGVSG